MRATSCSGTGYIMSISPDSSAATRVASDWIGVKTTSVRLCSFWPHQASLGTRTVFTPACRDWILNGPVPLVWFVAKFSTFFLTLAGEVAPFFSAHALLIMYVDVVCSGRIGFGESSMKSTV